MWNNTELSPLGKCRRSVINPKNNKKYSVEFVVYSGDFTPLLGNSTSQQMNLVTVNDANFEQIAIVSPQDTFSNVFDGGLGKLGAPHHLKVDDTVHPVIMPARRIPVAIRPKLKTELQRMEKLGVITTISEPTTWVSQLGQKRSGALRVCIDPRELNKALL